MAEKDDKWEVLPLEDYDVHPKERVVISSDGEEVCTILLGGLGPKCFVRMHQRARMIAAAPTLVRALGKVARLTDGNEVLQQINDIVTHAIDSIESSRVSGKSVREEGAPPVRFSIDPDILTNLKTMRTLLARRHMTLTQVDDYCRIMLEQAGVCDGR